MASPNFFLLFLIVSAISRYQEDGVRLKRGTLSVHRRWIFWYTAYGPFARFFVWTAYPERLPGFAVPCDLGRKIEGHTKDLRLCRFLVSCPCFAKRGRIYSVKSGEGHVIINPRWVRRCALHPHPILILPEKFCRQCTCYDVSSFFSSSRETWVLYSNFGFTKLVQRLPLP